MNDSLGTEEKVLKRMETRRRKKPTKKGRNEVLKMCEARNVMAVIARLADDTRNCSDVSVPRISTGVDRN